MLNQAVNVKEAEQRKKKALILKTAQFTGTAS